MNGLRSVSDWKHIVSLAVGQASVRDTFQHKYIQQHIQALIASC